MTSDLVPDSYSALHAHVDHDLPPLHEVLTPDGVALLALAGRHLSTVAYRDAVDYADAPLRRRAAKAAGRVLTLFPSDCDNQRQISGSLLPERSPTSPPTSTGGSPRCRVAPANATPCRS